MLNKNKRTTDFVEKCRFLFVMAALTASFVFAGGLSFAQTPQPSPTPDEVQIAGFKVISSVELGVRGRSLSGNENKFRSDFNYKSGFRVFNSSFSMEDKESKNGFFDSLLVNSSGWGGDPSGFTRVNVEKAGNYRFTSNVRRVAYFNSLNNHALNQHTQNTQSNMGDFDLTILPQSKKFNFNIGYSYNRHTGPGVWTARAYRDDFPVTVDNKTASDDLRIGVKTELLGFSLSLNQGFRGFKDDTRYFLTAPTPGNTTNDPATFATFSRNIPVRGEASYTILDAHRTFAEKLDFTGRIIYSTTETKSSMFEKITGRDNNNNIVDLDSFEIFGKAKRPQTRADIGITYLASEKFRISETASFDRFAVNGGEDLFESLARRNPAGNPLATTLTLSKGYRVNKYRRFTNTIEGDYQFSDKVSAHIGYRFTDRKVNITGFDRTFTSPVSPTNPLIITEDEENQTHTLIAGMKIKPTKNWVLFWDVEHGSADNVFTRVANYKFTNFRIRNRMSFKNVVLNLSAISKDNRNPSRSETIPPIDFGAKVKTGVFSGSIDWSPIPELSLSSGYTYNHQTSDTAIIIPFTAGRLQGTSQYYVRDHYAFFDVIAQPVKRVSIYASYRASKDLGQGDRTTALAQNLITSYPMRLQSPEIRASFRLSKNIDWNIGYQYFNYKERFQTTQNYRTHLPYTSLTLYIGGGDR